MSKSRVSMEIHIASFEAQTRELPPENGWRNFEATGMAWGRCSCGLSVEGPSGEPLPRDDVAAQIREHMEQVKAT